MPSWNIHIAHAERLLKGGGSVARAVRDRNAFLFGNLIPDIYVGYMVPGVVRPVPYRVTHFAKPEHIPKPRAGEFFDAYVLPLARECGLLDVRGDGCVAGGGIEAARLASDASGFVGADSDRAPVGPTGSSAAGGPALEGPGRRPPPSRPRSLMCLPRTRRRLCGISMWPKPPRAIAMRLRPPGAR